MATEADVVKPSVTSSPPAVTSSPPAVTSSPSAVTSSPSAVTGGGLIITITDVISSFLGASSTDSRLSEELRDLSSSLKMQSAVPYKSLKEIWFGSKPETRPDLSSLLRGSDFVFTSPVPRQKSEELKLRLKKLEDAAERKAYQELVKDITPRKGVEEPFSSYKDQLGLGLHVVVTMFAGYLVGFAAFRALFGHNPAMSAAGGILGLIIAMLVETLLFILRSSDLYDRTPSSTPRASNLKIKKNQ